jgi:magnesium chelatase family protein
VTVNLAPADLPKESGRFDLPIALGILIAAHQLKVSVRPDQYEFAGELALTGELASGARCAGDDLSAHAAGRAFLLPAARVPRRRRWSGRLSSTVRRNLLEVCAHLRGLEPRCSVGSGVPPMAEAATYPDMAM